jgi:hypothetical protein
VLVQSNESHPKFDMTRCGKRGMNGVLQIYEEVIRLVPLYDINDAVQRARVVLWCTPRM